MKKQHGISMIGALFLLVLISIIALIGLRLGPVYYSHYVVKRILNNVAATPISSKQKIKSTIMKRLNINGIDYIKRDNISITKNDKVFNAQVKYKIQKPLIANIDAIIYFDSKVEIQRGS